MLAVHLVSAMDDVPSPSKSATNVPSPSKTATSSPIAIKNDKRNSPSRKAGQGDKNKKTMKEIVKAVTEDQFLESLKCTNSFFELFAEKLLSDGKFASLVQGACTEGQTEMERLMNAHERAINLYKLILDEMLAVWAQKSENDSETKKKIEKINEDKVLKHWVILTNWTSLKERLLNKKEVTVGSPPIGGKVPKKRQTLCTFNNDVKERLKIDVIALILAESEVNCTCEPCTEMMEMARNILESNENAENREEESIKQEA
uniref:Uncharacterized protein n=1 Tax=Globodera pallida TaxID=36090 RepID=A0A183BT67_GLOPA